MVKIQICGFFNKADYENNRSDNNNFNVIFH